MSLSELFFLALGLSMDAFAVSVCKGLSLSRVKPMHMLSAGLYFGGFQAAMPLLGYVLGMQFKGIIGMIDHWIAFILLGIIGGNMIKEAWENSEAALDDSFHAGAMVLLATATSIDALAVGVTFAFLKVDICLAVWLIGAITCLFSAAGVKIGNVFGCRWRRKAQLAGGLMLIAIGVKILLGHFL